MNRLLTETAVMYTIDKYWVGVVREASQADIKWTDGTVVDTNLVYDASFYI